MTEWQEPTPELLAEIAEECKGKSGSSEDEIGFHMLKSDDYAIFHSAIGSQTAKLCERNPEAIMAVRVARAPDCTPIVFFKVDKDALRDVCAVISTPKKERTPKQLAADAANAERLRQLAKERSA